MRDDSPGAATAASPDAELVLGHVVGIFGIHGELRVFLLNRDSGILFQGAQVTLVSPEGQRLPVYMTARPGAGERVLARVDGLDDRDRARLWKGWEIRVPRAVLPPPEPGEYYVADLVGLRVLTPSGQELGELTEVVQNGDVDIWVVHQGGEDRYIPALAENVLEVDLAARTVRVSERCASSC